ncbi:uncharacterized protein LOC124415947 [Diprion similis]|uniref:uncharacterized protein LOC124415947 n=1 Tax=Diprion similis TaxID=362088 RepID=UPI001EF75B16|nr:uncharacterized protein LOC124415947 [Diprion similis]
MNRVLFGLAVFALAAREVNMLKCHMCSSFSGGDCKDFTKDSYIPLVECDNRALTKWHSEISKAPVLQNIVHVFEIDQPVNQNQNFELVNHACAKMNLKVAGQQYTLRTCQTAKTPSLDPCEVIRTKLQKTGVGSEISVDYCDLCTAEGCNGAYGLSPPKMIQLVFGFLGLMLLQAYQHCIA